MASNPLTINENDLSTFLVFNNNNNNAGNKSRQAGLQMGTTFPTFIQTSKPVISRQVKNISELKKLTPAIKLMGPENANLVDPQKMSPEIRGEMRKFCRACAGMKTHMVDIFSEKGMQMRLSQMMSHLEDVDEKTSFSTLLCMECIYDLKGSYKFFLQIKKAQVKLKSIHMKMAVVAEKPVGLQSFGNLQDSTNSEDHSYFEPLKMATTTTKEEIITIEPKGTEFIEEFDPEDAQFLPKSEKTQDQKTWPVNRSKRPTILGGEVKKPGIKLKSPSSVSSTQPEIGFVEPTAVVESADSNSKGNKENLKQEVKEEKQEENKVSPTETDKGIMYVTMKGSKPNELLLVKVKKMDKSSETNVQDSQMDPSKVSIDIKAMKPIGKFLSRYDSLVRDKSLFPVKIPSEREQKINQQIEDYKKLREQVLGRTEPIAQLSLVLPEPKSNDGEIKLKMDFKENPYFSCNMQQDIVFDQKIDDMATISNDSNGVLIKEVRYNNKTWKEEKVDDGVCLTRIIQAINDSTCEKNVKEFLEYLKIRRIVVSRLKDEDIVGLYDAKYRKDGACFRDKNLFECDFCWEIFTLRDKLREHEKVHDFKMMLFCDDCGEEFPTNKMKRNHNTSCKEKLVCRYCLEVLESRGKKRQHEQKHCDNEDGQLCDVCGEKLKHQGTLDQHIKIRHMDLEKIFQCHICPKKFALKTKLSFHVKSVHTEIRAFLCEDCGADFKNPASLRHHRIRKHQPEGSLRECPVCGKLVAIYSISKHMHTHRDFSIKCPHCDKSFKNTSTLKQHTRIHDDERQYRCDTCGVGFNRRDGLRLHTRVHENTNSRALKECSCQICGEKFPNHSTLVIHRNRAHKGGRRFTCRICNRSMISATSLSLHLEHIHNRTAEYHSESGQQQAGSEAKVDGDDIRRRVMCYQCGKTFKTEMILRTHVKNTHTEKKPMKCLDCDVFYTSKVRLKHHMMVEHNRLEGTLECPHCPKRFVNQLRLKTHMVAHSEERPHSCDICGFRLKTKIQLMKHKQNKHSDARPLQCRYCAWRCKQVSALVCHERTHTNERPYVCQVCKQRFKYLGDKNKHERRHVSMGGEGFKRTVAGTGGPAVFDVKPMLKQENHDNSKSDDEVEETGLIDDDPARIIKFETQELVDENGQTYQAAYLEQGYESGSEEAFETRQVIMNVDPNGQIYAQQVSGETIEIENAESPGMITSDLMESHTVFQIQPVYENGEYKEIPVIMLQSLDEAGSDVDLSNASITL